MPASPDPDDASAAMAAEAPATALLVSCPTYEVSLLYLGYLLYTDVSTVNKVLLLYSKFPYILSPISNIIIFFNFLSADAFILPVSNISPL